MPDNGDTGAPGGPADRPEWLGLTLLALPTPLVAMDMTSLFLALPRVTADLGASGVQHRMSGAPPDAAPPPAVRSPVPPPPVTGSRPVRTPSWCARPGRPSPPG
ncbi:hypothetical protein [Streptomyces sp. NPDC008317]|uniref:hypothetical protein n=1 Tax=Streptomyces sp. NPDC008317 TaxID=3364827 RepID=UPI0036E32690